jgi:hypothetical protein
LDADRTPGGGLGEELSHGGGYLFNVGFKSEVSRVQKLNGSIGVIARVGFCARRNEEWVVPALNGEQRRLRFAQVLHILRIYFWLSVFGDSVWWKRTRLG